MKKLQKITKNRVVLRVFLPIFFRLQKPKSNLLMAKMHSTAVTGFISLWAAAKTASEPTSCWLPCHGEAAVVYDVRTPWI